MQELTEQEINFEVDGDGNTIRTQFPPSNEIINYDEKIILYTNYYKNLVLTKKLYL